MKFNLFLSIWIICLAGCVAIPNKYTQLPPGQWRGILKLTDPDAAGNPVIVEKDKKIRDYFELPFNFSVEYEGEEMIAYLLNGEEKIKIEGLYYGTDRTVARDTIKMDFSSYDTYFDAYYEENTIEGYWIVNYKEDYRIPFIATYGQDHRFINHNVDDTENFDGKWKVTFEYDNPTESYPAVAEFKQDGNKLTGTFLTETGDYRYLDGNAYGNKLRLSVFDGSHAFLFSGAIESDTIVGEFRSGKHYKSKWIAVRDNDFKLQNPESMTKSVTGDKINLSKVDIKGNTIDINSDDYEDKIILINIMGTWCPNCADEIKFLKEIKNKYGDKIEVISLAYERYRNSDKCISVLNNYADKMGITWPIIYAGYANKKETSESLTFIDKIYSYPTLLTIDKSRKISNIHTGFSGPATSMYAQFKVDFNNKLDALTAN